jgi:hypothetical protein
MGSFHFAGLLQPSVEWERVLQEMRLMPPHLRQGTIEVIVQKRPIFRVSATVDDLPCPLPGIETTKVCITLLCDNEGYLMFCMIHMSDHGNDTGDIDPLGDRGSDENRDGAIPCKFNGAGHPGQNLPSSNVSRIDMTVNINLDRTV